MYNLRRFLKRLFCRHQMENRKTMPNLEGGPRVVIRTCITCFKQRVEESKVQAVEDVLFKEVGQ